MELPDIIDFETKLLNQLMRYMVIEPDGSDPKLIYEIKCGHDIKCVCDTRNGPLPLYIACSVDFNYLHAVVHTQPLKKTSGMRDRNETSRVRRNRRLGVTIIPLYCTKCGKARTCKARQNM